MKVIVVSHGDFSKGLVNSVQMLTGKQEELVSYGLYPEQTVDTLKDQLEKEIQSTPKDEEILFVTDLFHGSPFNAVVSLMRDYKFYHITGVNLPMLMEVMLERGEKSADEISDEVVQNSSETIINVNKIFNDQSDEEEDE